MVYTGMAICFHPIVAVKFLVIGAPQQSFGGLDFDILYIVVENRLLERRSQYLS